MSADYARIVQGMPLNTEPPDPGTEADFGAQKGFRLYNLRGKLPPAFEPFCVSRFKSLRVFNTHYTIVNDNSFRPSLTLKFEEYEDWKNANRIEYKIAGKPVYLDALSNSTGESRPVNSIVKNMWILNCPWNLAHNAELLTAEFSKFAEFDSAKAVLPTYNKAWNGTVILPVNKYKLIPQKHVLVQAYDDNARKIENVKNQVIIQCRGRPAHDPELLIEAAPEKTCHYCKKSGHWVNRCPKKAAKRQRRKCNFCHDFLSDDGCSAKECKKKDLIEQGDLNFPKLQKSKSSSKGLKAKNKFSALAENDETAINTRKRKITEAKTSDVETVDSDSDEEEDPDFEDGEIPSESEEDMSEGDDAISQTEVNDIGAAPMETDQDGEKREPVRRRQQTPAKERNDEALIERWILDEKTATLDYRKGNGSQQTENTQGIEENPTEILTSNGPTNDWQQFVGNGVSSVRVRNRSGKKAENKKEKNLKKSHEALWESLQSIPGMETYFKMHGRPTEFAFVDRTPALSDKQIKLKLKNKASARREFRDPKNPKKQELLTIVDTLFFDVITKNHGGKELYSTTRIHVKYNKE